LAIVPKIAPTLKKRASQIKDKEKEERSGVNTPESVITELIRKITSVPIETKTEHTGITMNEIVTMKKILTQDCVISLIDKNNGEAIEECPLGY